MTNHEMLMWSSFALILISTLVVTLFRSNDRIALRILFLSYEGSLVALWPLAVIAVAVGVSLRHSIMGA